MDDLILLKGSTLENCNLCPRNCGVNRLAGKKGYCKASYKLKVARAALHHWEEPCISGKKGSGTVFFSNCNLRCVFCQNYEISEESAGTEISIERLSDIFLELQASGANNINLVTPTHYVPQIVAAVNMSKASGLFIPILYNCSGYENIETIKLLKGTIDVYLPDLKYYSSKYSTKYSKAPDYFLKASEAIKEMVNQVGSPKFENGLIKKGVIVRHLMLPGLLFDSKKIIDFLYNTFKDEIYISIMNQYTPMENCKLYPEINKTLKPEHYDALIDYALNLGVKNGFIQDEGTQSKVFIPSFNLDGVN
ncbi:radical SAM protein [Clostridium sp. 19966]|uniref:radical SAM protein n=1 Tax=Clostridium sp. 19966 TaxID=2768166 RepID=UPI0028DF9019|nr:radical SAM protein [Clostridium sp. 19966]MDT8716744.1 radical SAM protein [Clostridium sp. 19966]